MRVKKPPEIKIKEPKMRTSRQKSSTSRTVNKKSIEHLDRTGHSKPKDEKYVY